MTEKQIVEKLRVALSEEIKRPKLSIYSQNVESSLKMPNPTIPILLSSSIAIGLSMWTLLGVIRRCRF